MRTSLSTIKYSLHLIFLVFLFSLTFYFFIFLFSSITLFFPLCSLSLYSIHSIYIPFTPFWPFFIFVRSFNFFLQTYASIDRTTVNVGQENVRENDRPTIPRISEVLYSSLPHCTVPYLTLPSSPPLDCNSHPFLTQSKTSNHLSLITHTGSCLRERSMKTLTVNC